MADGTEWKTKWHLTQLEKVKALESKMDVATVNGTRLKKELEIALAALQKKRGADVDLIQHRAALAATEQRIAAIAREQQQFAASREELAQVKRERDQQQAHADFSAAKIKEVQPSFDAYVAEDQELAALQRRQSVIHVELDQASFSLRKFKSAQEELASMPVAESHETLAAEQDALTAKVTAAKQRISEFEAKAREIAAFRGTLRSQMQAAAAATAVESEIAVLKAAGKLLQERQAALVEKAFKPLLAICNRFTSCVIPHELIYQDGKLGYMNKGTFVGSNTFNGAWAAVAFLGLATALCQDAKQRVVIFDELSRFDVKSKVKLIERMLLLTASGVVDQFLGNDLDDAPYRQFTDDRVKIIKV
jgi:hypothetical protein